MSRTDAHRPFRVWFHDEPGLVGEEHDHRDGTCDIADFTPNWNESTRTRCRKVLDPCPRLCSCNMCKGRTSRLAKRRSVRTAERGLARAIETGAGEAGLSRYLDALDERGVW